MSGVLMLQTLNVAGRAGWRLGDLAATLSAFVGLTHRVIEGPLWIDGSNVRDVSDRRPLPMWAKGGLPRCPAIPIC